MPTQSLSQEEFTDRNKIIDLETQAAIIIDEEKQKDIEEIKLFKSRYLPKYMLTQLDVSLSRDSTSSHPPWKGHAETGGLFSSHSKVASESNLDPYVSPREALVLEARRQKRQKKWKETQTNPDQSVYNRLTIPPPQKPLPAVEETKSISLEKMFTRFEQSEAERKHRLDNLESQIYPRSPRRALTLEEQEGSLSRVYTEAIYNRKVHLRQLEVEGTPQFVKKSRKYVPPSEPPAPLEPIIPRPKKTKRKPIDIALAPEEESPRPDFDGNQLISEDSPRDTIISPAAHQAETSQSDRESSTLPPVAPLPGPPSSSETPRGADGDQKLPQTRAKHTQKRATSEGLTIVESSSNTKQISPRSGPPSSKPQTEKGRESKGSPSGRATGSTDKASKDEKPAIRKTSGSTPREGASGEKSSVDKKAPPRKSITSEKNPSPRESTTLSKAVSPKVDAVTSVKDSSSQQKMVRKSITQTREVKASSPKGGEEDSPKSTAKVQHRKVSKTPAPQSIAASEIMEEPTSNPHTPRMETGTDQQSVDQQSVDPECDNFEVFSPIIPTRTGNPVEETSTQQVEEQTNLGTVSVPTSVDDAQPVVSEDPEELIAQLNDSVEQIRSTKLKIMELGMIGSPSDEDIDNLNSANKEMKEILDSTAALLQRGVSCWNESFSEVTDSLVDVLIDCCSKGDMTVRLVNAILEYWPNDWSSIIEGEGLLNVCCSDGNAGLLESLVKQYQKDSRAIPWVDLIPLACYVSPASLGPVWKVLSDVGLDWQAVKDDEGCCSALQQLLDDSCTKASPNEEASDSRASVIGEILQRVPTVTPSSEDAVGQSAFARACVRGDVRLCQEIVKARKDQVNLNEKLSDGTTLLMRCVLAAQVQTVKFLLSFPSLDLHAKNEGGESVIDIAEIRGEVEIINLLNDRLL